MPEINYSHVKNRVLGVVCSRVELTLSLKVGTYILPVLVGEDVFLPLVYHFLNDFASMTCVFVSVQLQNFGFDILLLWLFDIQESYMLLSLRGKSYLRYDVVAFNVHKTFNWSSFQVNVYPSELR